ncbi:MAG: helix-turn-helix transcriptional regulator [Silicimonas sp.]|nr:helix-turn-helix transcriptional regulator [Silicimonas sp.]
MSEGPEYLTVPEVAALLRLKERKIYDLAASGDVPVSRATGKLLFPAADLRAWIAGQGGAARADVLLGSHDPLLEWALRQSECGMASLLDGSGDGLARFAAGEGIAAGLHLHEDGGWNLQAARAQGDEAVLIAWAKRRRGIVMGRDDEDVITSLGDLRGRRFADRQAGSGTAGLLRHMLEEAGVPMGEIDFTAPARSEQDAVLAVAEGAAEATFGLEALARRHGLSFLPVVEERFDLLIDRRAYFRAPIQRLLGFCRTPAFLERAGALGGYDVGELGAVRWAP